MLTIAGEDYGTAEEIAHQLGPDVTPAMVRNWARRDGLRKHRVGRTVYYPIGQASTIERDKRQSGRGRRRRVDSGEQVAASSH